MNRKAVSGITLTLLLTFTLSTSTSMCQSNLVEEWVPYVPSSQMLDLKFWMLDGTSCINATITFPDSGYMISDWGTIMREGYEIWVISEIWDWTGISLQVITIMSHTYELGRLEEGNYTFTFMARDYLWDVRVKSINFTVVEVVEPTTWTVDDDGPADFSTIHGAVSSASPGDTIYVKAGTYREPQVTINKPLRLIGENKNTTIVDGGGTWVCLYVQNTQNVTISGFTVQNGFGMYSWGSQNITINGNIIFDNEQGIVIGESSCITVSKNIVTQNVMMPILLDRSSNSRICENIFTLNNEDNIWLGDSLNNSIYGNKIASNGLGVRLDWSSNNRIHGNNITNNGVGIWYWASSNNSIYGNKIEDNVSGIVLKGYPGNHSSFNTICGNNITNNDYGIMLSESSNNIFYHNSFMGNTWQVHSDYSINVWDYGYPSGGNYWSDYSGVDLNSGLYQNETGSDRIGDTPYIIDENNQDNYPLMDPLIPKPPSPVEATQELIENIETWNLSKGIETSLIAKLDNAIQLLDKGNENGAVHKLMAFINQVEALREKKLTGEQADYLISEAQRIIDLIKVEDQMPLQTASVQEIYNNPEKFYGHHVYVQGYILKNTVLSGYAYYLKELNSDLDTFERVPLVMAEGTFTDEFDTTCVRYETKRNLDNIWVEKINDVNVGIIGVVRYRFVPDDLEFRLVIEEIEVL